jgi:hypothetical protein
MLYIYSRNIMYKHMVFFYFPNISPIFSQLVGHILGDYHIVFNARWI